MKRRRLTIHDRALVTGVVEDVNKTLRFAREEKCSEAEVHADRAETGFRALLRLGFARAAPSEMRYLESGVENASQEAIRCRWRARPRA
jgi:hypothetical protein